MRIITQIKKYMNKNLVILMALFCIIQCYSQKQGNIWYFGGDHQNPSSGGVGLDFNSGFPLLLNNSAMPRTFGSASYCNSVGELLFYSNGLTIYDRTHQIMQNGENLGGDLFTPQSVLIVPFLNDTNKYYIFTSNFSNPASKGLYYSIVDMSLNNRLGAVTNPKATSLLKKM